MTTKVIQVATIGKDSILLGKEVRFINKDSKEYDDY